MPMRYAIALLLGVLGALAPVRAAEIYNGQPGPYTVDTAEFTWNDSARNRPVPVKIYFPKDKTGSSPVIIFSHGLGGSREGYEYLGRHWASEGFVSVHVQHAGSDDAVWRGSPNPAQALKAAVTDPANTVNRPLDISFVIDKLADLAKTDETWRRRLDLERIGVGGHSYGGNTALLIAGEEFGIAGKSFRDPRVIAVMPMSAPVPRMNMDFSAVKVPLFFMTGTLDDSPLGETIAAQRRLPFDQIKNCPEYLLILNGGDHMVFAGRRPGGDRPTDERFHDLIKAGSTAFWDAYLGGSASAKAWLAGNGFKGMLGSEGTFEIKDVSAR